MALGCKIIRLMSQLISILLLIDSKTNFIPMALSCSCESSKYVQHATVRKVTWKKSTEPKQAESNSSCWYMRTVTSLISLGWSFQVRKVKALPNNLHITECWNNVLWAHPPNRVKESLKRVHFSSLLSGYHVMHVYAMGMKVHRLLRTNYLIINAGIK